MKTTIFQKFMGSSPQIKVLEYLIEWQQYEMTLTDIANGANVSRTATRNVINRLLKQKAIKESKKIGIAILYKINSQDSVILAFTRLFKQIVIKSI